ncbi:PREDICTED: leucine-rich repeat-containing protein 66 [Bison bison bison]|uniref:Leucine-rich repeat-containing protein 66 n=1 Tax=Bison bison bison TaxID=43346 RepID=A0A6P3IUP1_BISBB|nr:PREDICTED: leucine-rich repeat-containing protein 66 [Bison bison bison]XP_010858018.1 PREDICTED: leucine-rich repeat-containing protein 66 [Bison bison bison]
MKNLCFRVITMVIGLYFTGTMTNPSRKSSILFNSKYQWNGYLTTNCSFAGKHEIPMDIPQMAPTVDDSSNFLRVLLQTHMKKEEWNIKHLDLSNNLISKITLSSLEHFHALETLNLSNNAIHSVLLDLPSFKSSWVKRHRGSLRNRLPFLKLLTLQRNKLSNIPKGLWKLKSLQSLDLSFNRISQIGLSDFHNCLQLENLHLKSNRIFRIHPEAFKDLKKLQMVDLSNNGLTAILPVVIMALELPHLEADLADNPWQCDYSLAVFQNVISESWRKRWNAICNESIGKEDAHWWTPTSRMSRETHLPHADLKHMKTLIRSKAERAQEVRFSMLEEDTAGSDAGDRPRELPKRVRRAEDVRAAGRKADSSQDLVLAVCLSVFITFFVAFCLGAFARPYVDRLWQQRCRKKSPGSASGNEYSNQAFYDEIEGAVNLQQPRMDLPQTFHHLNLYENQAPRTAVVPARTVAPTRREAGGRQDREQRGVSTGAGTGKDTVPPNHSAARRVLYGPPNAHDTQLTSAGWDHIYRNDPGEGNYDTVARQVSLSERSVGIPAVAARIQTSPSSVRKDSDELGPPCPRETTVPLSQRPARTHTPSTGEERGGVPPHFPSEFSKEIGQSAQQQRLQGSSAEGQPPAHYEAATLSDPGDPSPPGGPPGCCGDLPVTPAHQEPAQKHTPDAQYEVDSDSDSEEGSLFTLSSTSSEDWRNVAEEEADGEQSWRAGEPPGDQVSCERRDSVRPLESPENNIAFQKTLRKCENQEDHFGKTVTSDPDSHLCQTHLESASNTNNYEDPLPRSSGSSSSSEEVPSMSIYNYISALQPSAVEWQYSLRDLEFANMDALPQTPPCSAKVPSDPDKCLS